jgi:hypothetical protein
VATIVNPAAVKLAIRRPLERALASYADELSQRFRELIESPIFAWPNVTRRRNGQTVATPRDIVDRGDFRDSQRLEFPNPSLARFVWDIHYAIYVYFGWTTVLGTVLPGRDWITPAVQDFERAYAEAVKRYV